MISHNNRWQEHMKEFISVKVDTMSVSGSNLTGSIRRQTCNPFLAEPTEDEE